MCCHKLTNECHVISKDNDSDDFKTYLGVISLYGILFILKKDFLSLILTRNTKGNQEIKGTRYLYIEL